MSTIHRHILADLKDFSKKGLVPSTPKRYSHQITITAQTGVGSTTTWEGLYIHSEFAKLRMMMRFGSGGQFMRALAAANRVEILEWTRRCQDNPDYDRMLDQLTADIFIANHCIFEGRLPHITAPHAFHVLLTCSDEVAAQRRGEKLEEVRERNFNDNERYERYYPGCLWLPEDYDFVYATDQGRPIPECADSIIRAWKEWQTAQGESLVYDHFMILD